MIDLIVLIVSLAASVAGLLMLRLYLRNERPFRAVGFRPHVQNGSGDRIAPSSAAKPNISEIRDDRRREKPRLIDRFLVACAADNWVFGIDLCVFLGGTVHSADVNGWGPLHWAAHRGRFEAAKALLEHGAQIDRDNGEGVTPLMSSLTSSPRPDDKILVTRLLIESGADVNRRSSQMSVLRYAKTFVPEAVEHLVAAGATDDWSWLN